MGNLPLSYSANSLNNAVFKNIAFSPPIGCRNFNNCPSAPSGWKEGVLRNPILPYRWNRQGYKLAGDLVSLFIAWALLIAVLVFFFTFLRGGIAWITAGGDENKVKEAQGKLTGALIGLTLVFLVFLVLRLIGALFGIVSLENTLKLKMPSL